MRTQLRAATVLSCATLALVLGAGTATAAPAPTTGFSTNSDPVAVLLTDGGTGVATYRITTAKLGATKAISGFKAGDTALVGMDHFLGNNRLYGVGNGGGLYWVATNGKLTKVKQLSVALDGTSFGVDVNPAANALRIVSNTGQNLRQPLLDLSLATIADLPLNYVAGTTASGISAAAYTNNDYTTATGTTLFDLDATLDQVVVQAPANNGSLQQVGTVGVDLGPDVGFDIFTTHDNTRATGNTGYLVAPGASSTTLSTVALLTGDLTTVATIPVVAVDIAIQLVQQAA